MDEKYYLNSLTATSQGTLTTTNLTATSNPYSTISATDWNTTPSNPWTLPQRTYEHDWLYRQPHTIAPAIPETNITTTSQVRYNSLFERNYDCYSSSEDRITPGKRELVFRVFDTTKLDYVKLIKHLGIDGKLFNTLLLEYAIRFKMRQFMELFSRTNLISPNDLFNEVVKVYR